jgi:hypothetical protein
MPTIQCVCGHRFSGESWSPDGTVYCPQCGQALAPLNNVLSSQMQGSVPPMVQAGTAIPNVAYPNPEPSNQAAIVGFVLSLLSLFGCLILAPISLFVSVHGLRLERDRGLAIAGVVIGSIQSVVLLGAVAYFVAVAVAVGGMFAAIATITGEAMVDLDRQLTTESALDEAEQQIARFVNEEGELPDGTKGREMLRGLFDGWGNEIVYKEEDGESWSVSSSGPDQISGTMDDVERRQPFFAIPETSLPVETTSSQLKFEPVADQVDTVDEALSRVHSKSSSDVLLGLKWLLENDPEDSRRADVIAAMFGIRRQPLTRRQAIEVIQAWVSEKEMQLIHAELQKLDRTGGTFEDRGLVSVLGRADSSEWLIGLTNSPSSDIRLEARRLLKQRNDVEVDLVERCVEDLQKVDRREHAMELLEQTDVVQDRRELVCRSIDRYVTSEDFRQRRQSLQVLRHWGPTKDNIESLADVGALDLLVTIQDKQVLERLGEMLEQWPVGFQKAAAEMRRIGPASETYVWPLISNSNHVIATQALQLLGDVGTAKSISQVEPLLEEPLLRGQARFCIQRINTAQREPEQW